MKRLIIIFTCIFVMLPALLFANDNADNTMEFYTKCVITDTMRIGIESIEGVQFTFGKTLIL